MKSILWWFAASLAVVPSVVDPAALDPVAPDDSTARDRVIAVETFPARIVLNDRFDQAQLLLTGRLEGGGRRDLTREVEWFDSGGGLDLGATGLARGVRDGAGTLRLRVAGLDAEIPYEVRGTTAEYRAGFVRDVQPVLSRLGCNAGTCHGSAEGKNGFKLSLRGYDPETDHAALTDELAGRRFDRAEPDRSLFLLKPTGQVPHEGGKVLDLAAPEYELLRAWVAGGVDLDLDAARVASIEVFPSDPTLDSPGDEQQFAVWASYADGSVRDVTAHAFFESGNIEVVAAGANGLVKTLRRGEAAILVRYEGRYAATRLFVMGDREGFQWQPEPTWGEIDELVDRRLQEIRTLPSALCTDAEFLRRVHLDLTGELPTPKAVRAFLLDTRDTRAKRDEVVDRLIGSPEFVEHWTNRWSDLLQVNPAFLGEGGAVALREWVRGAVASNMPHDEFVRTLLASSGSTLHNPPAAYHKILRAPDVAMENTTQLFLGIRFNCNKCHDHPFERWTQGQHWNLAAYFADVTRADVANSPRLEATAVTTNPPTVDEIIGDGAGGTVTDPNGRVHGPRFPYEHGGETSGSTRREQLASWLTSPDNPYFALSQVNRLWSYFLGRGLIEPVDDIRAGNPATHPELLASLRDDFVAGGFDSRAMMRRICKSRTYQRSVAANHWNEGDDVHYAKAAARRLPAEVLFDAVHQAAGSKPSLSGVRPGTRARETVGPHVKASDGFLDLFGRPPRESACECERSNAMSLGQALSLVNGPTVADAIRDERSELADLARYVTDPTAVIDELYLRFLGRPPTDGELAALLPSLDVNVPANAEALSADDAAELARRAQTWEAGLPVPAWQVVEPGNLRSDNGSKFTILDDRSVLTIGDAPDTDVYTFVGMSELDRITGLRLEVIPHESLPNMGPGRAESSNFVLANITASVVPLADPSAGTALVLTEPTANFSQDDWPVASSIVDDAKGWGIYPRLGERHEAVFQLQTPVPLPGASLLVVRMKMPFGSRHVIGRFRISLTGSDGPIRHHGLPDAVAAALRVPPAERDPEQAALVHRTYLATDAEMAQKIRLGATQDLAWALATSPAFLFNR